MTAPNKTAFGGTIGKTIADSKPWWPAPGTPPQGAPNILVVLFDDVGFSDFGCYGSKIRTPTINALAAQGVQIIRVHDVRAVREAMLLFEATGGLELKL